MILISASRKADNSAGSGLLDHDPWTNQVLPGFLGLVVENVKMPVLVCMNVYDYIYCQI